MSFPNKYKVMFYSEIIHNINNPTHESIDFTSWADVPSPKFDISTIPSPLILRLGDTKDIGLQIKPIPPHSKLLILFRIIILLYN